MYKLPILIILTVFTFNSIAQNSESNEEPMDFAENDPQFPGGDDSMRIYIQENISYPEEARKLGEQGVVYVQFIVEKDGSLSNVKVVRGVSESLDAESVRVVKSMPNWIPGEQDGKKVRVRFTLPISYRLDNSGDDEKPKKKWWQRKKKKD